jgi:arsenite methyltransferase
MNFKDEISENVSCASHKEEHTGCGGHDEGHTHNLETEPNPVCKVFESAAFQSVSGDTLRPGGIEITEEAIKLCNFPKEAKLLDIGCGKGVSMEFIQNTYGFDIIGIDQSNEIIKQALSRNPKLNIKRGEADFLEDFPSFSFDGVLLECVLSLCKMQEEALHEVYCVLKKGGKLILSDLYLQKNKNNCCTQKVDNLDNKEKNDIGRCCLSGAFEKEKLIKMLEDIGFHIVKWIDKTDVLKGFAAKAIMEFGSLEAFWNEVLPQDIDKESFISNTVCNGKPGYFLLIAEKPNR